MAQIIVKNHFGTKCVVALSGHDRSHGVIECLVTLKKQKKKLPPSEYRRLAIAQAQKLSNEFCAALELVTPEAIVPRIN